MSDFIDLVDHLWDKAEDLLGDVADAAEDLGSGILTRDWPTKHQVLSFEGRISGSESNRTYTFLVKNGYHQNVLAENLVSIICQKGIGGQKVSLLGNTINSMVRVGWVTRDFYDSVVEPALKELGIPVITNPKA